MSDIICSVVGHYRNPDLKKLAKAVKNGDTAAVGKAAGMMAPLVKKGTVLVPIPSHEGRAQQTLQLARQIAALTGASVCDLLEGDSRQSSYELKKQGVVLDSSKMGFRLRGRIPEGNILVVDNVIASGNTAKAAMDLLPNARMLALTDDPMAEGRRPDIVMRDILMEKEKKIKSEDMEKTYYVEVAKHVVNDFFVSSDKFKEDYRPGRDKPLPAYAAMVDWMDGLVKDCPADKIPMDISPDRDMNIVDHDRRFFPPSYRVLEDSELVRDADIPFEEVRPKIPAQAKGFDVDKDAYVYTVVDTWRTVKPYKAESPKQAMDMAFYRDKLHDLLDKVHPVRQTLHEDIEHRLTINGDDTVTIRSESDLVRELQKRFPQGLKIRLADETFSNLVDYRNAMRSDEVPDLDDWMGLGNPGNDKMLVAHGPLKAELRLSPEDYIYISPCDKTYYDSDIAEIFEDTGVAAASLLLHEEKDLQGFRVLMPKIMDMQNKLYIENMPFRQLMDLAEKNGVKDDRELVFMLDSQYIGQQPAWLMKTAYEQTTTKRHQCWINKVAGLESNYHQIYELSFKEAAEKFGFSSAAELKKQLVRLNSEKSNKTVQLMEAAGYIHRQCEPVYTQAKKAEKFYEMAKASFEADFVRSFRAWSQKHVSDISFYPGKQQQMFVRCKIDGQQQMGKELNRNDAELLKNTKIGSETKDLALKAFKEDIIEAMGQTQKQSVGLKR